MNNAGGMSGPDGMPGDMMMNGQNMPGGMNGQPGDMTNGQNPFGQNGSGQNPFGQNGNGQPAAFTPGQSSQGNL